MDKTGPLTLNTLDRDGVAPDLSLLGKRYQHSGNQKTYAIVTFSWNGATDQWNFVMVDISASADSVVLIARPLEHLTGDRDNGERRYKEL